MKKYLAALGLVAACAACCAPLLITALSGVGVGVAAAGSSKMLGFSADVIVCAGVGAALLALTVFWLMRRRARVRKAACDCTAACDTQHCSAR